MSASLFQITEHIIPSQHIREYPSAVRSDQEDILHLHVKQYVPRHAPPSGLSLPGITIIGTHGNGFPKETHEALWDELLALSHSAGFTINSIWIADPTHQGLSYALNEDKLSDDPSWLDHSRDTLHMVNHFRAHLKRPIFGIGHSMGGAQLVHFSILHPRLLAGLILLDPVVVPFARQEKFGSPGSTNLTKLSTYRRDLWPSRAEAAVALRKSPMFASWDDRAWDAFVRHGLRDLPTAVHPELPADMKTGDPPVTLTTPIQQEVHTFMRPNFDTSKRADGTLVLDRKAHPDVSWTDGEIYPGPFYRSEPMLIHNELPHLRPPVLFILGGTSFTAGPELRDTYKRAGTGLGGSGGAAEGKAKRAILENVGHGVPFEAPKATAQHAATFVAEVVQEWKTDEEAWLKRQATKTLRDHVFPSEEWRKQIGSPPQRKKPLSSQSKI